MKKDIFAPVIHPDKLSEYWKREIGILAAIVCSGMIYNVGLLATPIFQGKLIDALVAEQNTVQIISLAALFIAFICVIQISRYIKRFYTRRFANNTSASMRQTLYQSMISMPTVQLQNENMGSLMTKVIGDVDACAEGMRKFTTEIFDTGVAMTAYFIAMCCYDINMTFLSCIFLPLAVLIAEKMKKPIYRYTNTYRKKMGKLSEDTYEMLNHALLYRIHGREDANRQAYNEQLKSLEKSAVNANVWENAMLPVYNAIAMCGVLFVIVLGGKKVWDGSFSIGVFSTYLSLFISLAYRTSKAAKLFNSVQKASVSWKRIQPYLQTAEQQTKIPMYDKEKKNRESSELEKYPVLAIEHMSFTYPGDEEATIKNLSLQLNSGERIGITGPVACGKTTFGKLFLGGASYQGSIKIMGMELETLTQEERNSLITYMGHAPQLLSDTIYQNITLGEDGDITEVLQLVCFDEDLKQMPNGIDTLVGSGGIRLSGGQQARIALARTLYHKKRLVILDDPFAALDKTTEKAIISNLMTERYDGTFLVISHRFGIFPCMDKVLVMDEKHEIICGTHTELLDNSELYRELYRLSVEKEMQDDEE